MEFEGEGRTVSEVLPLDTGTTVLTLKSGICYSNRSEVFALNCHLSKENIKISTQKL